MKQKCLLARMLILYQTFVRLSRKTERLFEISYECTKKHNAYLYLLTKRYIHFCIKENPRGFIAFVGLDYYFGFMSLVLFRSGSILSKLCLYCLLFLWFYCKIKLCNARFHIRKNVNVSNSESDHCKQHPAYK